MESRSLLYYLDTNICISFFRNKNKFLRNELLDHPSNVIKIPTIVAAELMHGAYKSQNRDQNIEQVKNFISEYEVINFDLQAACVYGRIRAELESIGKSIGPNDLFIAALVLSKGGVLVTHNTREFSRIEGLLIEDWTQE